MLSLRSEIGWMHYLPAQESHQTQKKHGIQQMKHTKKSTPKRTERIEKKNLYIDAKTKRNIMRYAACYMQRRSTENKKKTFADDFHSRLRQH